MYLGHKQRTKHAGDGGGGTGHLFTCVQEDRDGFIMQDKIDNECKLRPRPNTCIRVRWCVIMPGQIRSPDLNITELVCELTTT